MKNMKMLLLIFLSVTIFSQAMEDDFDAKVKEQETEYKKVIIKLHQCIKKSSDYNELIDQIFKENLANPEYLAPLFNLELLKQIKLAQERLLKKILLVQLKLYDQFLNTGKQQYLASYNSEKLKIEPAKRRLEFCKELISYRKILDNIYELKIDPEQVLDIVKKITPEKKAEILEQAKKNKKNSV